MTSYPDAGMVLDALGEKVQQALGKAVSFTIRDLDDYRVLRPDWVARHRDRGLANWISDHLWYHVTVGLDAVDDAETREQGVTREVLISDKYRLRIKRHHLDGMVSTYPTQTALEFLEQPVGQLPGLEQVHLIAGYEWDQHERRITRPVLSLRDTNDVIIWVVELPMEESGRANVIDLVSTGEPNGPEIVLDADLGSEGRAEEES